MSKDTDEGTPQEQPMEFTPLAVVKVDERGRIYLPRPAVLNLFDLNGIPLEKRFVQILLGAGAARGMVLLQPVISEGTPK